MLRPGEFEPIVQADAAGRVHIRNVPATVTITQEEIVPGITLKYTHQGKRRRPVGLVMDPDLIYPFISPIIHLPVGRDLNKSPRQNMRDFLRFMDRTAKAIRSSGFLQQDNH